MKKIIVALVILWIHLIQISGYSIASDNSVSGYNNMMQIDTIVVTATAETDDKQKIDSRTLKTYKVMDLAEVLSGELVEVQMIRKGAYGNEISMRGFGQENMKVLIDGNMLEGACGSRKDPPLSHINMLTVQSIAIQQGPFDVTKPGCLGGHVDVVTKKPRPGFDGEILGKIGSYGFHSEGFIANGGNDKVQGLFGYNFSESGQYEDGDGRKLWEARENLAAPYNSDGRDAKAFRKHDAFGKVRLSPNSQHAILLEHSYGKAKDILTPRVVFDTEKERTNLSKMSWEMKELGGFSKNLTVSLYRNQVEHYPFQAFRSVASPKNNLVESVITGGGIRNVSEAGSATLTCGVDMYHRDWWGDVYDSLSGAKVNDLIPSVDALNVGGYVQLDRKYETWSLGLGLRYDRFRQKAQEALVYSGTVTDENRRVDNLLGGHVSARYFPGPYTMIFGGVGRSYRTPEGTERYIQGSSSFFGNPKLEPTANTEIDLGFKHERGSWVLQAKAFYSDLDDYIYQENNLGGYQTYANIDAHIYGADMKAGIDLALGFSLEGGLALQRGRKDDFPDNNDDGDLGQIAPLKSRLAINYKSNGGSADPDRSGFFGTVEWVHSDASGDYDEDAGEIHLAAWDILNLRTSCRFRHITLNAGVENVFDRKYTVANSYEWDVIGGSGANPAIVNEPGRFLYASAELKF